jgi:hypothetical protein
MAIGQTFPIEPVSGIILQRQHFAFFGKSFNGL